MLMLAQLGLDALALGAAYALVALGFVLILNATGAVNFAQGELVMAGGYVAAFLAPLLPIPTLALLPVVMAATALIGLAALALAYLPLQHRPPGAVFISTIAIGVVLQNGAIDLMGPEPRATPPLIGGGELRWGELALSRQSLAVLIVAALLVLGQRWLFAATRLGRQMRATAEDRRMAAALGIPVTAMVLLTFALAAALAGAAGLLLGHQFFIAPGGGGNLILKAYIAVVIGGWGSLEGAVLGALLVALFETVAAALLSYATASALLYAVLIAILFLRPQGIFGEAAGRRA